MEFAQPYVLLVALLALPVLAMAFARRRGGYVLPAAGPLFDAPPSARLRLARLRPVLRVAAIVLLAIAAAGPRVGDANAIIPGQGIDIAIALDISGSMTTSQLSRTQTRLEAAKAVTRQFIQGRENDRIGLVVFQNDALALSPPTLDYMALDRMVDELESGILPDGTGIGIGLATALNMLRDSTAATRIVILLTDGQHNARSISPEDAISLATALRVRVYTIGIVSDSRLSALEVDEELLKTMAGRTGGQYFRADSPQALADIYDEIGSLATSAVGRDRFERFEDLAAWFAIPAAALLVAELILGATWLRRAPA